MKLKINMPMALQISASILFIIGAIFMLINTFNDAVWSFWLGLIVALIAAGLYILMVYLNRRDNTNKHGTKTTNTDTNSTASSTDESRENKTK